MQVIDFLLALSNAFYHRLMLNFIKTNPVLLLAKNIKIQGTKLIVRHKCIYFLHCSRVVFYLKKFLNSFSFSFFIPIV